MKSVDLISIPPNQSFITSYPSKLLPKEVLLFI
jgi:hypothetical protein